MSSSPPEDLLVLARQLHPEIMAAMRDPRWSEATSPADWRAFVPATVQRLWGRLDFESKIAAFVVAATAARALGSSAPAPDVDTGRVTGAMVARLKWLAWSVRAGLVEDYGDAAHWGDEPKRIARFVDRVTRDIDALASLLPPT